MKLSAVVTTFNNASVLKECLESLSFADEIVVVDHESTDQTVAVARKFTKRIYSEPNDPSQIDIQKNFGFAKAKGEWILSIDSDERVPAELADEIKHVISSASNDAFRIPRKNIIFGKWIQHSLWWPDYQIRLFKNGKARYTKDRVHHQLEVDGTVGELEQPLTHENYQTLSQYLQKMDRYTESEAKELVSTNSHMQWIDAIRMPLQDFLKTFFLQQGYKDGLHGLVLSVLQAFYAFLVFAKVWEKQGFREENNSGFLSQLFEEWVKLQHEVSYWFFSSFIKQSTNPLMKVKYMILRKRAAQNLKQK